MNLYTKTIETLKENNNITELYRFQGSSSFEHFNIKTSKFNDTPNDSYVYFSGSLDHHKYFTNKRLKQLLNNIVLADSPYQITSNNLRNDEIYKQIKNLIINSDKLSDLYSIKLITDNNFIALIRQNCFLQHQKNSTWKSIERVDRRVYGGGYGIASEWKDLLTYLTYFNAHQKIDRYDILKLLSNYRTTGKVNQKNNVSFLLTNPENYKYELNEPLESDFTKYKIRQCLETIVEKEMTIPGSNLHTEPEKTIKKITTDYEKGKDKVLTLFKDYSK